MKRVHDTGRTAGPVASSCRRARLLAGTALLAAACATPAPSPVPDPPAGPFATAILDTGPASSAPRYGFQYVDVTPAQLAAVPPGQQALVWLGGYDNKTCAWSWSDARIAAIFGQYRIAASPHTGAYFLADEPNTGHTCPSAAADVRARARLVRSLDSDQRHFTLANIDDPAQFGAFAGTADVLATDPYPCRVDRACDWSLIPAFVAALRAAGIHRYMAMLQAFREGQWRWPTAVELEHILAQWQKSDWSGQITFSWSYAGGRLSDHPDLLSVLQRFNARPRNPLPQP